MNTAIQDSIDIKNPVVTTVSIGYRRKIKEGNDMRIGELGNETGVDIETIRHYEKIGLLSVPPREPNGYRNYETSHLERLAFIRHCRALDMPLADVKRLLDFITHPEVDCGEINRLIDAHLHNIRERLHSMQSLEKQLEVLRARCGDSHIVRDCGILSELVAASHKTGAKSD
mgnify:CR=1 FL=1|jgi:Cd(II)/Pb(II)-responsive transcriptional regulator